MKQFLKVLSVVKFIVEGLTAVVASLMPCIAANVPRTGNCREMGDFPELLPRSSVASKPLAPGFYPAAATDCPQMPSRIIPLGSRRAFIASPNCRPRGSFANMTANRRLAVQTD